MARNATRSENEDRRLAVLIDADNAQPAIIEGLLAEVAKFGTASVRRIYGNWTSTQMGQWKAVLLTHSLNPVQQFAYTSGKNATDASMIIDAMDLLYTGNFDGFCLVSSDSDFTRLAQRLREAGLIVYGFGERKTPEAFVNACDKFVYTEVLRAADAPAKPATKSPSGRRTTKQAGDKAPAAAPAAPPPPSGSKRLPEALIRRAIEEESDDTGWALLSAVGNYLTKVQPDFDSRHYGHRKLRDLLRAHAPRFVIEERDRAGKKVVYVRTGG
jgi:hypothetical protein